MPIRLLHHQTREIPLSPLPLRPPLTSLPLEYSHNHPPIPLRILSIPNPLPLNPISIPLPDRLNPQSRLHTNIEECHELRPASVEARYHPRPRVFVRREEVDDRLGEGVVLGVHP